MYGQAAFLFVIRYTLLLQIKNCGGSNDRNRDVGLRLDSSTKSSKPSYSESQQGDGYYASTLIPTSNSIRKRLPDLNENGDTLTQDDIVRHQYELLPYPPVTKESIEAIRKHYYNEDKRKDPLSRVPGSDLETINHYLFKGRNDFT